MMLNSMQRRPEGRANRAIGMSRAALYGTTALVLSAAMISPAVADEVDDLKMEMQQLLDRMEQLERNQTDTDAAVRQANVRIDEVTDGGPWVTVPKSQRRRASQIHLGTQLEDLYVIPETAQDNGVTGGDFPGSFKLPGTDASMAIYGFIKADYVWDFGPLRAFPALLDPGLIPTDGMPGSGLQSNANFRINPSQINIETRFPSEYGQVSTLLQFDFFRTDNEAAAPGPNNSTVNEIDMGVRLAQASLGPLTVGQHWWAFTDLSQYAETIDYENLNSAPLGRLPGITWAESVGGGWSYAIGVYDPVTQIAEPTGVLLGEIPGTAGIFTSTNINTGMPDFAGNVKYSQDWGHIFASGQVRQFGYELDSSAHNAGAGTGANVDTAADNWIAAGRPTDEFSLGWGFTLGLNLFDPLGLHPRDRFYTNATYGEGIRGIIDHSLFCFTPAAGARGAANQGAAGCENEGTVDPFTGELEPNTNYAWMAHYQHWWTDTIRSSFIYGQTHNDSDNDFDLAGTLRTTRAAWVNLLWSPVPRVNLGVEVQYADVRIKGNDGIAIGGNVIPVGQDSGETFQIQLGALFLY